MERRYTQVTRKNGGSFGRSYGTTIMPDTLPVEVKYPM